MLTGAFRSLIGSILPDGKKALGPPDWSSAGD